MRVGIGCIEKQLLGDCCLTSLVPLQPHTHLKHKKNFWEWNHLPFTPDVKSPAFGQAYVGLETWFGRSGACVRTGLSWVFTEGVSDSKVYCRCFKGATHQQGPSGLEYPGKTNKYHMWMKIETSTLISDSAFRCVTWSSLLM